MVALCYVSSDVVILASHMGKTSKTRQMILFTVSNLSYISDPWNYWSPVIGYNGLTKYKIAVLHLPKDTNPWFQFLSGHLVDIPTAISY